MPRGVGALGARRFCSNPRCALGSPAGTPLLRGAGILPELCGAGLAQPGCPTRILGAPLLSCTPCPPRGCGHGFAAPSGLQSTTKNVWFYLKFLKSSLFGAFSRQRD